MVCFVENNLLQVAHWKSFIISCTFEAAVCFSNSPCEKNVLSHILHLWFLILSCTTKMCALRFAFWRNGLLHKLQTNSFTRFSVHPSPKECLEICLLRMLTFNPLQKLSENNQDNSNTSKDNECPSTFCAYGVLCPDARLSEPHTNPM